MAEETNHRRLTESAGRAKQKVLIVDDQPLNLAFAAAEIEDICDPIQAYSGEQALKLAGIEQPDLILLDVQMPGMTGFEACRLLKQNCQTAEIPVIFLTCMDEEADEEQGLNLGAIDYIAKPFSPAILRARVRNHLLIQRQRMQLERLAQCDGLTGVANRRSFDQVLNVEWQRLAGIKEPLGLLMIDVDLFKGFNDHYGHLAGDQTLQQVATTINRQMQRAHDLACRYGGEEFACILPHADQGGAKGIAESIRSAILDLRIEHAASPVSDWVTVSIGAVSIVPTIDKAPETLISQTDQCLYQAKTGGRNQVNPG
ncbi:diguanylate cyclase [Thiorhodovibrio litoralis]|uniref:diguanylate cyclase n=1 Tax=Thiorhodovibrio litoralis TaxID=2952932 RepID=UPI002B25700E|nr:diguanylate cyclase [Thiorhodovibrio litoralis]WPL13086.1 Bacteriophytochrome cph2 [Thiorhodovibrio litoralis]